MSFKLLCYFDLPEEAKKTLQEHDVEIKRGLKPTEEGMCADIADCDGLIAFEQPEHGFNRKIIDSAPKLKLIARRGVGYETVDWKYAEEKGIYVTNTPAINSRTVAEAAVMLMLECARNAQKINLEFREKKGEYKMFTSDISSRGFELTGLTLGLLGCGNIGKHVAQICSQGFGMKVYGYDAYAKNLPSYIEQVDDADFIYKNCDFVSIHMPLTDETKGSVNMDKFKLMKPSSFLINTSRGPVINEEDLIEALDKKIIRGAGLDVYSTEPISENSYRLFDFDRVEMTPHNASFTVQSLMNAINSVVKSVCEVADGKRPKYAVNNPASPRNKE